MAPRWMKLTWGCDSMLSEKDLAAARKLNILVLGWALSFAILTMLFESRALGEGPHLWLIAMLPIILGILAVRGYIRFLRNADELLRKILVEGLAFGFGAGAVFMLGYRLFERLGAPRLDLSDPLLVMVAFATIGHLAGVRRYS